MAKIDFSDGNAVVIIGSGAGGGTLAHELTRRGIKVVLLEAGKRQSLESFSQVPGEAFAQLTWLDPRTQSGDWRGARDFRNQGLCERACRRLRMLRSGRRGD